MDTTTALSTPLAGKRFLVVGDERFCRAALITMLKKLGASRIEAIGGTDAARLLQSPPAMVIDGLLIDHDLLTINALDILKTIRIGRYAAIRPHLPVIMLSATTSRQFASAAMALDVSVILIKPITLSALGQRLSPILSPDHPLRPAGDYDIVNIVGDEEAFRP
jgi:CheY-like chemotaxis protein